MSIDRRTLEAKPRQESGKGPARRLRAQGLIPAVVYGRHLEQPSHISVDPLAIKNAIATPHRFNTLIMLKVADQGEKQVLLKDYQMDPVSREILHADFVEVRENEKVKVKVPLLLVGKPVGVAEGGILSQTRRDLEVLALPSAIPEKIEADVSHLKMAQALHINDIKLPPGIEVNTKVNYTLAVVAVPEKEEVVAPPPTVAAPGEPGAIAPAEGAEAKPAAAPGTEAKAAPGAAPPAKAAAAPARKEEGKKEDKKAK